MTPSNHYCFFMLLDLGEELTIDYATFQTTIPTFQCWCGASICRGQIESDAYREQWFQDCYGSHVTPYILTLIEIEKIKNKN